MVKMRQCNTLRDIQDMTDSTNEWVKRLQKNDAEGVSNLFCSPSKHMDGGQLLGTISQTVREGEEINKYFDYFANRPGIKVSDAKVHPAMITCDVGVTNVLATMKFDSVDDIDVRLSYVWRKDETKPHGFCLALLHGSEEPVLNKQLRHNVADQCFGCE